MTIKKGDNVIVLTGKDKGQKGKVVKVFPRENKLIVEGLNVYKRHRRARRSSEKGQIIELPRPMHASNVALMDGGKPTRLGVKVVNGKRVRIAKKSGQEI